MKIIVLKLLFMLPLFADVIKLVGEDYNISLKFSGDQKVSPIKNPKKYQTFINNYLKADSTNIKDYFTPETYPLFEEKVMNREQVKARYFDSSYANSEITPILKIEISPDEDAIVSKVSQGGYIFIREIYLTKNSQDDFKVIYKDFQNQNNISRLTFFLNYDKKLRVEVEDE